jgi:hypothetical protein
VTDCTERHTGEHAYGLEREGQRGTPLADLRMPR